MSVSSIRIKGDVQVISLRPDLATWDDYVDQIGKRKPLTRSLAHELLREKVADQYTYAIHPRSILGHPLPHRLWRPGNLVVDGGIDRVGQLANGNSYTPFSVCGVGASGTDPTLSDNDNNSPILPRQNVTYSYQGASGTIWDTSFAGGANQGTWVEAGLFDSLTGGTMGSHALFATPVNKGGSQVIVEWIWQIISG